MSLSQAQKSQHGHGRFLKGNLAGCVVLVALLIWNFSILTPSQAQPTETNAPARLVTGMITLVSGSRVEIDSQAYTLAPNASIKDEEENEKEITSIVPGAMAKARVRQGRIDQMILILPK